jgi:hypothetical protein
VRAVHPATGPASEFPTKCHPLAGSYRHQINHQPVQA